MEPEKMQESQTNETSQSSYNKRPLWQWIAIYAVVGIVLYGFVYYFFLAKKQNPYSTNRGTQNNTVVTQLSPTSQPSVSSSPIQTGEKELEAKVTLTKSGFNPQTLKVKVGTKVVWSNVSGATATVNSSPHPAHTDYPPLNLGQFDNGETLSLVFDKAGTYKYHNHLNSSQFGTITVE